MRPLLLIQIFHEVEYFRNAGGGFTAPVRFNLLKGGEERRQKPFAEKSAEAKTAKELIEKMLGNGKKIANADNNSIIEALKKCGRFDLIGNGEKCLVPASDKPRRNNTAKPDRRNVKGVKNYGKKKKR